MTTCQARDSLYYGLQAGTTCHCGDDIKDQPAGTCDLNCEGDLSQQCGGQDSTRVFPLKTKGQCFSGDVAVLTGFTAPPSDLNTRTKCSQTCVVQNKAFYGVQDNNCYCGDYVLFSEPGDCDIACPGDRTENCGGSNAIFVSPVNEFQSFEEVGTETKFCRAAEAYQAGICTYYGKPSNKCTAAHAACVIACLPGVCPEP